MVSSWPFPSFLPPHLCFPFFSGLGCDLPGTCEWQPMGGLSPLSLPDIHSGVMQRGSDAQSRRNSGQQKAAEDGRILRFFHHRQTSAVGERSPLPSIRPFFRLPDYFALSKPFFPPMMRLSCADLFRGSIVSSCRSRNLCAGDSLLGF